MNEPFAQSIERYLQRIGPLYAPHTLAGKRSSLRCFCRWLREHHPQLSAFDQLDRTTHIEPYLQHIGDLKASSRCARILHLRQFFEELLRWDWPEAPTPALLSNQDFPPIPQLLPKPLPPDLDQRLQELLARTPGLPALGLRLLRLTGMRVGEMRALGIHALEQTAPQRFSLRVPLGKTRTERVIPISPNAASLIEEIRAQRGLQKPVPSALLPYLMVDPRGRHLCESTYRLALKELTAEFPPGESIHPHRLRHSFATEMARAQMPLPALMKMLGHRTPKITIGYVQIAQIDLRRDYERALGQLRSLPPIEHPALFQRGTPSSMDPIELIGALIRSLETLRRDAPSAPLARHLYRFVKRIRRAKDDLQNIL